MKIANVDGRAVLLTSDDSGLDVAGLSAGQFGPELPGIYERWEEFVVWAAGRSGAGDTHRVTVRREQLGCPSPSPRQIVAFGLNYATHAKESGLAAPTGLPPTFTKFVSSLTGPDAQVTLPEGGKTDWEVELVVIVGREASKVPEDRAWEHVAGLAIGQDISERATQLAGPAPQFSLGKSFPNFAPVGPWLVTPDGVPDRDDLGLGCSVNGESTQDGRTSDLIFPVAELIAGLTSTITLYPGDLVFTGTPAGVGAGRDPQVFLEDGDHLTSWIEGLGEMHQTFVVAS